MNAGLDNEQLFLDGLNAVYQTICSGPIGAEARAKCDKMFLELFEICHCRISGLENIPSSGGNIIVMNHHIIHPYYTLPNQFQLSLDAHFVSALTSFKLRGVSPLRVVRQGREDESAHAKYYGKFQHLMVKTNESGIGDETVEKKAARLQEFLDSATRVINSGTDIVMCPEGTSRYCKDSPGPFKPGAFLLASKITPEPLILPVAIANFDKRFSEHNWAIVVKKPFYLSDRLRSDTKEDMSVFLDEFADEYRVYVDEARTLAED